MRKKQLYLYATIVKQQGYCQVTMVKQPMHSYSVYAAMLSTQATRHTADSLPLPHGKSNKLSSYFEFFFSSSLLSLQVLDGP